LKIDLEFSCVWVEHWRRSRLPANDEVVRVIVGLG